MQRCEAEMKGLREEFLKTRFRHQLLTWNISGLYRFDFLVREFYHLVKACDVFVVHSQS
jgi:hypothetical protein